ncbi:MAG: hypothetical protein GY778_15475, partial [bacterium]|nr:hypothetical protein [bacterium]
MKIRPACLGRGGQVTAATLLMLGSLATASAIAADPVAHSTAAAPGAQVGTAVRPSGGTVAGHSTSNLPRIRLFEQLETQPGITTLAIQSGALSNAGSNAGRFVVEDVPLHGDGQVALELRRFHVAGPGTRFVLGRRGGADVPLAFDPAGIVLLSGTVVDHPESHVFMALSDMLSAGRIELGPGRPTYRLSHRLGGNRASAPGKVAIFRATASGSSPDVPLCGLEPTRPPGLRGIISNGQTTESAQPAAAAQPATGPVKGMRTIELAIETDYDYFVLFGDSFAAAAYVIALIGADSDIYMRETKHRFRLTFVRIWDDPNDLYNDPDGYDAFDAFVAHWENSMGSVQRDAAQYLTGRRDLPFGGVAYLNAVCSFGYGMCGYLLGYFPDPDFPSVYHYDIEVSAHELGHNCGSPHTDAYNPPIDQCYPVPSPPQRGTTMSYCSQSVSGGNAVHELRFHARTQTQMSGFLTSLSCVIDDCNMNDQDDAADIAFAVSPDVNGNGIPDECEDCDTNGVLDTDDIAGGAPDLNGNTIPDRCEPDCNTNGVPDDRDILLGTSTDAYGNNVPDDCEADCNSNGTSDF